MRNTIRLAYFDISDLPIDYLGTTSQTVTRTVNIYRIIPSQKLLDKAQVNFYDHRKRMVDDEGHLPYGIVFAGSDTIHLIDGHHRWYSCLHRGRKWFRMELDFYPFSFVEAVIEANEQFAHKSTNRLEWTLQVQD